MTLAPKVISWATFPLGARSGTKMKVRSPAAAALPARELAALPVEEQAMILASASRALATAMALARSFKDAVGFWPSSFTYSCFRPSISARRGSSYKGELPTRRGVFSVVSSMGSSSRYRHMDRSFRAASFSLVSRVLM